MKKFLSLSLLGVMILSTTACAQTGEMRYAQRLPPPCYTLVSKQYDAWGIPHRIITENCDYHYNPYNNPVAGGAILGLGLGALRFGRGGYDHREFRGDHFPGRREFGRGGRHRR